MSSHRWILSQPILTVGDTIMLPSDVAQQIRSVLRLHVGDAIVVCDGHGNDYEAIIHEITRNNALARIISVAPVLNEPPVRVTIYQGLIKPAKFEWMIQKCTEIGAVRFVPVQTQFSMKGLEETSDNKRERWQSIAREAAEQCGRGIVPEIADPMTFAQALANAQPAQMRIIPWEHALSAGDKPFHIRDVMDYTTHVTQPPAVAIFIGPEGGFAAEEIDQARAMNALPVTLGSLILRAETAAMVALTLAIHTIFQTDAMPERR